MLCKLDAGEPFWVRCFHNSGSPPLDKWGFRFFEHCSIIPKSCVILKLTGWKKMASELLAVSSISTLSQNGSSHRDRTVNSFSLQMRKDLSFARARVCLKLFDNYTWPLVSLPHYVCFSLSISVPWTSSSPHPVVLPGVLLFLGWYVRPDHVGAAAQFGWLRAEVPRPRSLSRLVSPNIQYRGGNRAFSFQHFTFSTFIIHARTNEMLSQ